MDRYAVFGNPVGHSKSPQIHRWFAEKTHQELEYSAQLVELGQFEQSARAFFDAGGLGLNITVPFKQDAFEFADSLTERAKRAGAVNTLARQPGGSILGDNTDGYGLVMDICDHLAWPINARRILVLGAGGAVRGVLAPIFAEEPLEIVIANRTVAKAVDLASEFADLGKITGMGYRQLQEQARSFGLVINATSLSLSGEIPPFPPILLTSETCAYDMVYANEPTAFMTWAKELGCRTSDGLGMLVGQAAESFFVWRGVRPEISGLIKNLRDGL
ncbi:MAG: shikimate dehydrogenase [Pseudohongiellaceae bacterium]